ncbi:iron transporter [Helicobacter sp. L8]|uniref:iron transporter n=1 Tax=Helicobacter sp. L8 TaxID=2316078 RepID=UPI000EAC02AD|nr:iron transporter [Helicobacter sp. L8]
MKSEEESLLKLALWLTPILTLCMCFGVIVTIHDCGCDRTHILQVVSVAVLGVLSFLPIREIYKYTGWDGCVVSGIVNAVIVGCCFMLSIPYS